MDKPNTTTPTNESDYGRGGSGNQNPAPNQPAKNTDEEGNKGGQAGGFSDRGQPTTDDQDSS